MDNATTTICLACMSLVLAKTRHRFCVELIDLQLSNIVQIITITKQTTLIASLAVI